MKIAKEMKQMKEKQLGKKEKPQEDKVRAGNNSTSSIKKADSPKEEKTQAESKLERMKIKYFSRLDTEGELFSDEIAANVIEKLRITLGIPESNDSHE